MSNNVVDWADFDDSTWSQQQWQNSERAARQDNIEQRLSELVVAQIAQQPKLTDMKPGLRRQVIRDMVEVAAEIMGEVDRVAERL